MFCHMKHLEINVNTIYTKLYQRNHAHIIMIDQDCEDQDGCSTVLFYRKIISKTIGVSKAY